MAQKCFDTKERKICFTVKALFNACCARCWIKDSYGFIRNRKASGLSERVLWENKSTFTKGIRKKVRNYNIEVYALIVNAVPFKKSSSGLYSILRRKDRPAITYIYIYIEREREIGTFVSVSVCLLGD